MKLQSLRSLIVLLALSAGTAFSQVNHVDSATVSVTGDGQNISQVYGFGTVIGLGCRVTSAVTGYPYWQVSVSADGQPAQAITGGTYYYSTQWGPAGFSSSGTGGSTIGDSFFIPLNIQHSYSLRVYTNSFYQGATGTLTCSVFRR